MIPYQPSADDEVRSGQPFLGSTWRRLAANAQHLAGTRGRILASMACHHPVLLPLGGPLVVRIPHQATPWERVYAVCVTIGTPSHGVPQDDWSMTLTLVTSDLAGGVVSPAQRPFTITPAGGPLADAGWVERAGLLHSDDAGANNSRVPWPVLPAAAPPLVRASSGWMVHEPAAALRAVRDRELRILITAGPVAGWGDMTRYLTSYAALGFDDREIV